MKRKSRFFNMRLKYIAGISLLFVFVLLVGVYLILSHMIIYPSFAELEDQLAYENIERCHNAIKREIYHLSLFNQDWAYWDDSYRFIEDQNPQYIKSNLNDEAFEVNNIDLMYFLNNQKQLCWHRIYDEDNGFSEKQLQTIHQTLTGLYDRIMSEKQGLAVLVKTPVYPLLLTSEGIYDTQETKPSRGRLVMGRFLDDSTIRELIEQTHVDFEILPLSQAMNAQSSDSDNSYKIVKTSPSQLQISSMYPDLDGKPAYQVRATLQRNVSTVGKEVTGYFLIVIISTSTLLFALLLYFLDQCIIHPIFSLTEQIRRLRKTKTLDKPVRISHGYETQTLAAEFNRLIDLLELDRQKRKQIEQKLIESAKQAEQANEAKSNFLANMSHEIRTPMNSILGFSELLLTEPLSESQKEYVETIFHNGSTLLSLINDILDMSKIESGNLMIEEVEYLLFDLTKSVKCFIDPLAMKKSLDFKIVTHENLPEQIMTDPLRLRQCLINLLGNAIKFTSRGHVYLNIYSSVSEQGRFICFEVEDTGIGIPADQQKKIFEPFTQANVSTTRNFGGTGLGLSITTRLVQLLGGTLTLQSKPDKGSTFMITLPMKQVVPTQLQATDHKTS